MIHVSLLKDFRDFQKHRFDNLHNAWRKQQEVSHL